MNARSPLAIRAWLGVAGGLLLQGCPQLIDDDFLTVEPVTVGDAGCKSCGGDIPKGHQSTNDGGTSQTDASIDGPPDEPPGEETDAGARDAASETPPGDTPSCWTLDLTDSTHDSSSNCLGIHGWNTVEVEAPTAVAVTYEGGKVCFDGQIARAPDSWGAVYSLTFANQNSWNAAEQGVTGFALDVSGPTPATEVRVIYTSGSGSDYCRVVKPLTSTSVPFDTTHPNCATDPSAPVPSPTALKFLRLAFIPKPAPYTIDFCLGIRALP